MAVQSRNQLKQWFQHAEQPDQDAFWDWLDSFFHKQEKIPIASVNNLQEVLDSYAERGAIEQALNALGPQNYNCNNSEDFRVNIMQGCLLDYIVIIANQECNIRIVYGDDVDDEIDIAENKSFTFQVSKYVDENTFIKFVGLPINSTIKIYKK